MKKILTMLPSRPGLGLFFGQLFLVSLLFSPLVAHSGSTGTNSYRQPAYISNGYFSDKMMAEGDSVQSLSIVKALQSQQSGVIGYFILDLILTRSGQHEFKVNILNEAGVKKTELVYPQVKASKASPFPLYTAVGSLSGEIDPGIWFFKVYDRVDQAMWQQLGTFSIMVLPSEEKKVFISPESGKNLAQQN
ncbi:MAG: hypothetical protein HQL72_11205 [Magnetococcales bacterium]|nr:hypothetical protein [Magnetococcales bacterium]